MNSCSCASPDFDGVCDVYQSKIRKARKQYTCYECGCVIMPGEKYEHTRSLFEGYWSTNRICLDCLSLADVFFCNSFIHGALWEDFWDHTWDVGVDEIAMRLAGLTPAARIRVADWIEEQWGDENDDE